MANIHFFALAALASLAASAPAMADGDAIDPRTMTQAQVRAHNAILSRDDPNYIRCVKSEETGSLARKRYSCRTNAMWTSADQTGNQNARDTFEAMQGKAMSQGN